VGIEQVLRIAKSRVLRKTLEILLSLSKPFMGLVYRVYEQTLEESISRGPIPEHVAIIPDGNRRWALMQGLPKYVGHESGYRKMKEVLKWLYDLGVRVVTIYAMSYENCIKRPEGERMHLYSIIERGLRELIGEAIARRARIRVKGRLDLVPESLRSLAREAEERTAGNGDRVINIALCYGGRQEIVDAIRRIARDSAKGYIDPEEITEDLVVRYLEIDNEPDLVIRTSGELRISNFLLWQSAYSELYFCEAFWPEFRRIDLLRAIRSYQLRERRYGG
jgi:tritrans,polycis-undecaprenyl-diphosphate synthase [geranylgeranyl-diphosphate specific]